MFEIKKRTEEQISREAYIQKPLDYLKNNEFDYVHVLVPPVNKECTVKNRKLFRIEQLEEIEEYLKQRNVKTIYTDKYTTYPVWNYLEKKKFKIENQIPRDIPFKYYDILFQDDINKQRLDIMAIKKFYTVQEINSLINKVIRYQTTIDTFTDQVRYYSNYNVFKKLVDEAIKQGEELIELLDYLLRDTETIKEVIKYRMFEQNGDKRITIDKDDILDEMKVL